MLPKVRGIGIGGGRGGGCDCNYGGRRSGGRCCRNLVIKDGSSRCTYSLARGHDNSNDRNEMTKNTHKSLTAFTDGWGKISNPNQPYFSK